MRTTSYIHVNSAEKLEVSIDQLKTSGSISLTLNGNDGADVSLFLTPAQAKQIFETIGTHMSIFPESYVEKSISKLEEIKND
jgi:hypothetical protein